MGGAAFAWELIRGGCALTLLYSIKSKVIITSEDLPLLKASLNFGQYNNQLFLNHEEKQIHRNADCHYASPRFSRLLFNQVMGANEVDLL